MYSVLLYALVDCKWGDWTIGECSVTCGGGSQTDTRQQSEARYGGKKCEGKPKRELKCNNDACPGIEEKIVFLLIILLIIRLLYIHRKLLLCVLTIFLFNHS